MPKTINTKFEKWANLYSRPDIERLGIFSEMPYIKWKNILKSRTKDKEEGPRNFYGGYPHGIGDPNKIERIFIGEATRDRGKKYLKPKPFLATPFISAGGAKKHGCPGDYYGCFAKYSYFSNLDRGKPPYKETPKNLYTSPAKKGNTGYPDITINRYPEHKPDPYQVKIKFKEFSKPISDQSFVSKLYPKDYFEQNPFKDPPTIKPGPTYKRMMPDTKPSLPPGYILPTGPGKKKGGCQAGGFSKWPEHPNDIYYRAPKRKNIDKEETSWKPHSRAPKSYPTITIIKKCVGFRVNQDNYRTFQPTYTSRLLAK